MIQDADHPGKPARLARLPPDNLRKLRLMSRPNIDLQFALRWLAGIAATAAAYYLGGRIGLAMPYVGSHISLIWPPTGIALAILLRWELGMWPGVWLGAFLVNLAIGSTPMLAAGIACGNTLGPWLGAYLLKRLGFRHQMERRRDMLSYLFIGAVACMALNASNGVLNLSLAGLLPREKLPEAWLFWWLGDAMGALVAGVPLLTMSFQTVKKNLCCWRGAEILSVMAIALLAANWLFSEQAAVSAASPLLFVPFLLLGWLSLRGDIWPSSFTVLLLSGIAAWHTTQGHGPFHLSDTHLGLALLWSYMAAMAAFTILIAVVISELKTSEERFRQLFKRHDAVMLLIDPLSGDIVDANPSAAKFYGYPVELLCRMRIQDINALPPGAVTAERQKALAEKRNYFVFPHRLADGELRTVEVHSSPVEAGEGKHLLFSIIHDITERKRAEEKLRETQLRLAHIVDVSPTAIYVVKIDPTGVKPPRVSFTSQNISRMTGYSLEEWGQAGFWENHLHPDDREHAIANQATLFENGALQHQYRYRHRDGHWLWIHDQLVVERNEAGQVVELVGSWLDITSLKQAEDELKRLNENLEQRVAGEAAKNREKDHLLIQQSRLAAMGEMIGNIAHQWRQPINALNLLLVNIKDAYDFGELSGEELQRQVKTGNRLIQQMSTTIDDFRNFFRPDKEKAPFSLSATLAETREILGASLANHNIALEEDVPHDITVTGYANEYAQALLNLINNANEAILAKNIETGRIRVEIREEDGMAVVRVTDNGGGIPEEVLPKIFDPYFTTKAKGTGIGLYMTKAIVETNMGGRIEVRNTGDGAEFIVAVPLG